MMKDKIVAVTCPDDVLQNGDRCLLFDLTEDQMAMISAAMNKIETFYNVIFYISKSSDDYNWLLDKKLKSDLIIFNADSEDQVTVGYLSAQPNSCYFGTLKNISATNKNAIYDVTNIVNILEKVLTQ